MLSKSSNCTYHETSKYSNPRRRPVSTDLPVGTQERLASFLCTSSLPAYLENPKAPLDQP